MTDTPRTTSYLLGSDFQDGQNPGSITPQRIRDMIVSIPDFSIISAPYRPEGPSYGAKFDGSTDDTNAWLGMFSDIAAKGYGEVIIPGGVSIVQGGQLSVPAHCLMHGKGRYSSLFRRKLNSAGILLDIKGTGDNNRISGVVLRDFGVEGDANTSAGVGIRYTYASEAVTENVRVYGLIDSGFLITASWDSYWNECFLNWVGQGCAASTATTIGQEAIVLSGGFAASGFGSSGTTGGNNNLTFNDLRAETFPLGLSIQKQYCAAGVGNSQIRFNNSKWESTILGQGGLGNTIVAMSNDTRHVWFDKTYFAADAVTGNANFFDLFSMTGNSNIVARDTQVWINNANQVRSVFYTYPGQPATCRIDQVAVDGPGSTAQASTAVILNAQGTSGFNVPYRGVNYVSGQAGAVTSPVYSAS